MGTVNLKTASGGSVILSPANTASDVTITVPAANATMAVNGPAFSAYLTANQSISANTYTKILFDAENFDTNNNFASSRFTPTVEGYYQVTAAMLGTGTSITVCQCSITKNGTGILIGNDPRGPTYSSYTSLVSGLVYLNGTTDYLEIRGYMTATSPIIIGGSYATYFQAAMVRSAT